MSFEQKLIEQFESLNISGINASKHLHHLYADYVELVCLISNEIVSKSDILDRLVDNVDNSSIIGKTLDGEIGDIETEISDKNESWITTIFNVLLERKEFLKDSYAFDIIENQIKLKSTIGSTQKFYLYLLISSSLKYFKKLQNVITSDFEILSEKVLTKFLPPKAIVKAFGNNSDFTGNAKEKIERLAYLLNLDVNDYEINQISPISSKEEGLDIIGWIPFDDSNANTLIILVQCGCGKNWVSKRFETSRYENFYRFYKHPPIHTLFIPYALSNKDGRFYQSKDIATPTLVFERIRIMQYVKAIDFNTDFQSKQIIEKCIDYQEDIV
ncbi:MAG: hypothetical protein L3J41_00020 [Melioribacteraceae bacterium]|nr:hypothetical protein [Melioribacteraceae bacterium]